jgi:UrcA family protein
MNSLKLLTLAAAVLIAGTAQANTRAAAAEVPSVVVQYDDLNLNSKAGVSKLHARLRHAAARVCASLDSRARGLRHDYESCVNTAVEQGYASIRDLTASN